MRLYNADLSPNALRVRAVSNELGTELEIVDVDLRGGENRTAEYLAMNPNGKVPVLVDGDFVVWESRAINVYLTSKVPGQSLYPGEAKARAIVDQWSYWQTVHLGPAMQRVAFEGFSKQKFGMGTPDQAVIDAEMKNVGQFLAVLEGGLAGKEWIAGSLTLADFSLACTFVFHELAGISLDSYPNVRGWTERIGERPSWQRAVEPMKAFAG